VACPSGSVWLVPAGHGKRIVLHYVFRNGNFPCVPRGKTRAY